MLGRLRRSQKEIAPRRQRIREGAAGLLLQISLQVDHQITAGDQIEAGEWWISQKAVDGEHDEVSQLRPDHVVVALEREELGQTLRANVAGDGNRVSSARAVAKAPASRSLAKTWQIGRGSRFAASSRSRIAIEKRLFARRATGTQTRTGCLDHARTAGG